MGSPLRVCIPPAACQVEPAVSSRRSRRIASVQPAFVRWYRTLAPTTPPPMTTTWADDFTQPSVAFDPPPKPTRRAASRWSWVALQSGDGPRRDDPRARARAGAADVGALPGGYDAVLDDGFVEVGQSGRVWTRDEMLMALAASPGIRRSSWASLTIDELAPTGLARPSTPSATASGTTARSIWIRSGGQVPDPLPPGHASQRRRRLSAPQ